MNLACQLCSLHIPWTEARIRLDDPMASILISMLVSGDMREVQDILPTNQRLISTYYLERIKHNL
jgi:hypothetical protein